MKIKFKRKLVKLHLFFAVMWTTLFIVQLFLNPEEMHWSAYGWLVLALGYFGIFFYQHKYPYLNIGSERMCINGPLGKNVYYNQIKDIKKFAGDYTLSTQQQEVTINGQLLDQHSKDQLEIELEKLLSKLNLK